MPSKDIPAKSHLLPLTNEPYFTRSRARQAAIKPKGPPIEVAKSSPAPLIKMSGPEIPQFTGSGFESWLGKFNLAMLMWGFDGDNAKIAKIFAAAVVPDSPAAQWLETLEEEERKDWDALQSRLKAEFGCRKKQSEAPIRVITTLKLDDRDIGTDNGSGVDRHVAWARKILAAIPKVKLDVGSDLVLLVLDNVGPHLRRFLGSQYPDGDVKAVCTAVRDLSEADIGSIRDEVRRDQQVDDLQRTIRQLTIGNRPSPSFNSAPRPPPARSFPVPPGPTRWNAPQSGFRPAPDSSVDVEVGPFPANDDGKRRYKAACEAFYRKYGSDSRAHADRPFPLTPGTAPLGSGECFKCGQVGHLREYCHAPYAIPTNEAFFRGSWAKRQKEQRSAQSFRYLERSPSESFDHVDAAMAYSQGTGSNAVALAAPDIAKPERADSVSVANEVVVEVADTADGVVDLVDVPTVNLADLVVGDFPGDAGEADGVPFRAVHVAGDLEPMMIPVTLTTSRGLDDNATANGSEMHDADGHVDCGAMMNTISHSWYVLHQAKFGPLDKPDFHFRLADGSRVRNEGSITLETTAHNSKGAIKMPVRFQVMETRDSWSVLLGRPWLKDWKVSVDYGKNTLKVVRDGVERVWPDSMVRPSETPVVSNAADDTTASSTEFNPPVLSHVNDSSTPASDTDLDHEGLDIDAIENIRTVQREFPSSRGLTSPIGDRAREVLSKVTIGTDLTDNQLSRVRNLVLEFHSAFALDLADVEECPHTQHKLHVNPEVKLTRTPFGRPLTQPELIAARAQVDKLLKAGILERCLPEDVKCCAPIVMAPKKGSPTEVDRLNLIRLANDALRSVGLPTVGTEEELETPERAEIEIGEGKKAAEPEYRMCHNFAQINAATVVAPFPPGDLDQKVLNHSGKRYISKIDALGAFYWVPLHPDSRGYLCFFVQGMGYLRYKRLPMGPTGSPGTYQVALERTLDDLLDPGPVSAWMDDIFTSSNDFESMLAILKDVFQRAIKDNLRFAPAKTFLFVSKTSIGGSMVDSAGVSPDPSRVADLLAWPKPTTAHALLSFVNTAAVFRTFIPRFAEIARPLYELTKDVGPGDGRRGGHKRALQNKSLDTLWTDAHDLAFVTLQTQLTKFPVVTAPTYDGSPFHIACDASAKGFGAHLYQERNEVPATIAYASRGTTEVESKSHSSDLEMRCAKWAMEKFEKFTYGQRIILETDCQAVRDLLRSDTSTGYRAGWKEAICGSRIVNFVHRPGVDNVVADGLSRVGTGHPETTEMGWEQRKGVSNSLVSCNLLAVDSADAILARFRGDANEDLVRWITQLEVDRIDDDDRLDVQRRAARFWLDNGKLMQRMDGYGAVEVVPAKEGPELARSVHESTGHLGRDLMLASLVQGYYWKTMKRDVDECLATCPRCVQFGSSLQRLLLKPVLRFSPFDLVAMDFLSMPKGHGGYNLILVAIDCFTRYIMTWTLKGSPTASMVIKALDDMSARFVCPRELLVDNFFDCREVQDWAAAHNTTVTLSAPYAHVGLAENANHLVLERLRRLTNLDVQHMDPLAKTQYPTRWPLDLAKSVCALNERKLSWLSGYSPKDLLFCAHPSARSQDSIDPSLRLLLLGNCRSEASEAFIEEQLRRKSKSKTRNVYEPKVGDLVLVFDATGLRTFDTSYKLRPRWQGPLQVVSNSNRSSRLAHLDGRMKDGRVGWVRMKPWKLDASSGSGLELLDE